MDGVRGVWRGVSSGDGGTTVETLSSRIETDSTVGSIESTDMVFFETEAWRRLMYPLSPPWNHETCRHPAMNNIADGTHDPPITSRDVGRRVSSRKTTLYRIRMRKKDDKNRRSFRSRGKRLEIAKSNVGSWHRVSIIPKVLRGSGHLPP